MANRKKPREPLVCETCQAPIGELNRTVLAGSYPTLEFAEVECAEDLELTIGEFLRKRHVLCCTTCIMYGHIAAKARLKRQKATGDGSD